MSYKGYCACIKNIINVMMFKEIIAVSSGKYATKYINVLCGKYSEMVHAKADNTYWYHFF
jgi:hypothetical protein